MSKSRIPSPSRSQGAPITPRRYRSRRALSVTSPARSDASGRLTSVVERFLNNDQYAISPMKRRSVLPDDTAIEKPSRASWWKRLDGSSRDILETLDVNTMEQDMLLEDCEIDIQKEKQSQSVPESSDNESIASIVVPQRKLFKQAKQPQDKFGEIATSRKSLGRTNIEDQDKTINTIPKSLFNRGEPRNRPVFPDALLNSTNKTINKTVEPEPRKEGRNIFGQAGKKRKNMFTNLVLSESEDESEIQHKVFGFKRNDNKRISLASRNRRMPSLTPSVTTEIDGDDWNHLPSSTMIGNGSGSMEISRIPFDNDVEEDQDVTLTEVNELVTSKSKKHSISKHRKSLNQTRLSRSNKQDDDFDKTLTNEDIMTEQTNINRDMEKNAGSQDVSKSQHLENDVSESHKNNVLTTDISKRASVEIEEVIENDHLEREQDNINEQTTKTDSIEDEMAKIHSEIESKNESEQEIEASTENVSKSNTKEISNEDQDVDMEKMVWDDDNNDDEEPSERDESQENDDEETNENVESEDHEENNKSDEKKDLEISRNVTNNQNISEKMQKITQSETHKENNKSENNKEPEISKDVTNNQNISEKMQKMSQSETHKENNKSDKNKEPEISRNVTNNQNISEKMQIMSQSETNKENNKSDENKDLQISRNVTNNQNISEKMQKMSQSETHKENKSDENKEPEISKNVTNNQNISGKNQKMSQSEIHKENNKSDKNKEPEISKDVTNNQNISEKMQEITHTADNEKSKKDLCEFDENEANNEKVTTNHITSIKDFLEKSKKYISSEKPIVEDIIVDETPNSSHNTTGRNSKRDETELNTPEAVLQNMSEENISFKPIGRSTTFRKSKSAIEHINARPTLIPVQESTVGGEGSIDSSAEGSGWDSHRTTRRTLRQTFGKDFTPRKSLRALVMAQSAKRQAEADKANLTKNKTVSEDVADHHVRERRESITNHNTLSDELLADPDSTVLSTSAPHVHDPIITKLQNSYSKSVVEFNAPVISNQQMENEDMTDHVGDDSGPELSIYASYGEGMFTKSSTHEKDNNDSKRDHIRMANQRVLSKEKIARIELHLEMQEELDFDPSIQEDSGHNAPNIDKSKLKASGQHDHQAARNEIQEIPDTPQQQEKEDSKPDESNQEVEADISEQEIKEVSEQEIEQDSQQEIETESDQEMQQEESIQEMEYESDQEVEEEKSEVVLEPESDQEKESQELEVLSDEEVHEESDQDVEVESDQEIEHESQQETERESEQESENESEQQNVSQKSINDFSPQESDQESDHDVSEDQDREMDSDDEHNDQLESDNNESGVSRHNSTNGHTDRVVFDNEMSDQEIEEVSERVSRQISDHEISEQVSAKESEQEVSVSRDPEQANGHDESIATKKSLLFMQIQKVVQQNMEMRLKIREDIRNSIKPPRNANWLMSYPIHTNFSIRHMKKPEPKKKRNPIRSNDTMGQLPKEFLEDLKYKPPKRFQPANAPWITKRLYKFLETKLEPKYDYRARVRAEELVQTIYSFSKLVRRFHVAPQNAVDELKREMARLNIVKTHFEFYDFFREFMPREIRIKVNPDIVNKIGLPRKGVFSDILESRPV